jgi:putative GTP pyrophosphokinase
MILERKQQIEIPDSDDKTFDAFQIIQGENPRKSIKKIAELMQLYNTAMKSVSIKLEALDEEFQIDHIHSPIHHLECRIKGIASIYRKMHRYGVPLSLESAREHIYDIAGIRVICNFVDDIYAVEKMLIWQPDVKMIIRKDYIASPKENGYRSLHIVVEIPVFLSVKTERVPVEIQLRTVAMDYWASLEHMLKYKSDKGDVVEYTTMLLDCANTLADTEKTMQYIRERIEE